MDAMAYMLLQTTRKLNFLENNEGGSETNIVDILMKIGIWKLNYLKLMGHDSEISLDWMRHIETIFNYKMIERGSNWIVVWKPQIGEGKHKIDSWTGLKKQMRDKWATKEYEEG